MSYYQHHVFCCQNQREEGHPRGCCANRDAEKLRDYFKAEIKKRHLNGKGQIRVNGAGCLDRCELGPVIVIYPQEIWYHAETTADIDEIIESHLIGGEVVERLQLSDKQKLIPN